MSTTPLIFSISDYDSLGSEILSLLSKGQGGAAGGAERGVVERKIFSDGERYLRLLTPVRGRDVILVGGTVSDAATLDIFDLACGIVTAGALSLKIFVPFFGYSTMERAVKSGEVVTAKTRARLFSAIPSAPFGTQVVMLDLHSEGIPFYFEGAIKTHHMYAKKLIMSEAQAIGEKDFVLGCVDAGRAKWVESLANDMNVPAGFVYKRRDGQGQTKISGVNVDVDGRHVIIYDDMIRSGGSMLGAVRAYKDAGAKRISVIATHGLFTDGGLKKLRDSGLVDHVTVTNSHPAALQNAQDDFLKIISTAQLFVDFYRSSEAR